MGWIAKPETHLCWIPRISPSIKVGDVWECEQCRTRYIVYLFDYGHDVMPGEPSSELKFKRL